MTKTTPTAVYNDTVSRLQKAGKLYRSTRGRAGIYSFLDEAYRVFCIYRDLKHLGRHKFNLRKLAGLGNDRSRTLADLIFIIAVSTVDRRERHRWKKLIEAAYKQKIETKAFKQQLQALHGVNNAILFWGLPPQLMPKPGDKMLPGMEYTLQSPMHIPFSEDGN